MRGKGGYKRERGCNNQTRMNERDIILQSGRQDENLGNMLWTFLKSYTHHAVTATDAHDISSLCTEPHTPLRDGRAESGRSIAHALFELSPSPCTASDHVEHGDIVWQVCGVGLENQLVHIAIWSGRGGRKERFEMHDSERPCGDAGYRV